MAAALHAQRMTVETAHVDRRRGVHHQNYERHTIKTTSDIPSKPRAAYYQNCERHFRKSQKPHTIRLFRSTLFTSNPPLFFYRLQVNTATVAALSDASGAVLAPSRFRPNVVIEGP
jgi:hypothetical protein